MDVGILVPMTFERRPPTADEHSGLFAACELLGFHSLWVTDQILYRTQLCDPLTVLTSAAAGTRRIRLGIGVLLLVLRYAIHVARAAACLDVLSGGRFTVGASLGGQDDGYAAMGIDKHTRVSRFVDSVMLMRQLWSDRGGGFRGRFLRFHMFGDTTLLGGSGSFGAVRLVGGRRQRHA